ncbi:MAG TPA: hypothetical protein VF218_12135 [Acidothermaceae bacterium]|jgi:hypothetical protein
MKLASARFAVNAQRHGDRPIPAQRRRPIYRRARKHGGEWHRIVTD